MLGIFWKAVFLLMLLQNLEANFDGNEDHTNNVSKRSVKKSAKIGGSRILECDIDYPQDKYVDHIIQWKKEGIEVPIFIKYNGYEPHIDPHYSSRLELLSQATIELMNIQQSDEGWYECKVTFLDGAKEKENNGTWTYLAVYTPPVLGKVSPNFLVQKPGTSIQMFCEAQGTPEPVIAWYKNGNLIKEDAGIKFLNNRIELNNMVRDDGGVYTCTFKNLAGIVSHQITLVIEGSAYIMTPPRNTTTMEGERVRLTCHAEGWPNNITYRWYKDGRDVQLVAGLMARAGVYADGRLVISSVVADDTGWYKCRPSNGLGIAPEAEAFLNVTFLPKVLPMPTRIYLPLGMSASISCKTIANPPVTLIVWTRNEHVIDFSSSPRYRLSNDGTLSIDLVTKKDSGRYTCMPYSPLGADKGSPIIQAVVRDPPRFIVRPDQMYQRQINTALTMPCMATGDPPPTVTWRKADGAFPSSSKTLKDGGNLTIAYLTKEDHGVYECIASNMVTTIITTTMLIIEYTTPHAPHNLSVVTSQFSARVSWMPAYDGGHPQHYVLWYRYVHGDPSDWMTMRVLPDTATSFTVYSLYPKSQYQFMVLARNSLGDGLFSQIISAKTKGYIPKLEGKFPTDETGITYYPPYIEPIVPRPSPPTNLTVHKVKDGLHIKWVPPQNSSTQVLYYRLEYRVREKGATWTQVNTHVGSQMASFLWTSPPSGKELEFQVISFSRLSFSDPSVTAVFTTEPEYGRMTMSTTALWALLGALIFIILLIVLICVICKLYKRRKRKQKKYGDIKYLGPKSLDNSNGKAEGDQSSYYARDPDSGGRYDSIDGSGTQRVFTIQDEQTDWMHDKDNVLLAEKLNFTRNKNIFNRNFLQYDTDKMRRGKRNPQYEVAMEFQHPMSVIQRSADGRFVLDDRNVQPQFIERGYNVNDVITEPGVRFLDVRREYDNQSYHHYENIPARQGLGFSSHQGVNKPPQHGVTIPQDEPTMLQRYHSPGASGRGRHVAFDTSNGYRNNNSPLGPRHYRQSEPHGKQPLLDLTPTGLHSNLNSVPSRNNETLEISEAQGDDSQILLLPPRSLPRQSTMKPGLDRSIRSMDRTFMTSSPDIEASNPGNATMFAPDSLSTVYPSQSGSSSDQTRLLLLHSDASQLPSSISVNPSDSSHPSQGSSQSRLTTQSSHPSQSSLQPMLPNKSSNPSQVSSQFRLPAQMSHPFQRRALPTLPHQPQNSLNHQPLQSTQQHHQYLRQPTEISQKNSLNQSLSPYIKQRNALEGHKAHNYSDSSSSTSSPPRGYTRDKLQRVVDKVRSGPRVLRTRGIYRPGPDTPQSDTFSNYPTPSSGGRITATSDNTLQDTVLEASSNRTYTPNMFMGSSEGLRRRPGGRSHSADRASRVSDSYTPHIRSSSEGRTPRNIPRDLYDGGYSIKGRPPSGLEKPRISLMSLSGSSESVKNGVVSPARTAPRGHLRRSIDYSPDSSGLGSASNSQSTSHNTSGSRSGSSPGQVTASLSSSLTPPDPNISMESSPFSSEQSPHNHHRDISGDENYEFDPVNALESELIDALRSYQRHPDADREFVQTLERSVLESSFNASPPPPPDPQEAERFAKLREEYQEFRRSQQARSRQDYRVLESDTL